MTSSFPPKDDVRMRTLSLPTLLEEFLRETESPPSPLRSRSEPAKIGRRESKRIPQNCDTRTPSRRQPSLQSLEHSGYGGRVFATLSRRINSFGLLAHGQSTLLMIRTAIIGSTAGFFLPATPVFSALNLSSDFTNRSRNFCIPSSLLACWFASHASWRSCCSRSFASLNCGRRSSINNIAAPQESFNARMFRLSPILRTISSKNSIWACVAGYPSFDAASCRNFCFPISLEASSIVLGASPRYPRSARNDNCFEDAGRDDSSCLWSSLASRGFSGMSPVQPRLRIQPLTCSNVYVPYSSRYSILTEMDMLRYIDSFAHLIDTFAAKPSIIFPALSSPPPRKPVKTGKIRQPSTNFNHDDPTKPETRRCQYLRGTLRRPIENATGKSRTISRRIGRTVRNSPHDALRLGVQYKNSRNRQIAATIGRSWSYSTYPDAPEIIFGNFPPKRILPIDISAIADIISPVTSWTVHGVAREHTETKNTSQNLPPRRDTRPVRAGSSFVNHVEVLL